MTFGNHGILRVCLALGLVLGLAGCGGEQTRLPKIEKREALAAQIDESRMAPALAEAQSTFPAFLASVRKPEPGAAGYSVKVRLNGEYLWLNEVRELDDGAVLEGKVNTKPAEGSAYKFAQTVQVPPAEVIDWMYMVNGKLRGGFTIVAVVYGTSEQDACAEKLGIDWSQYAFLKSASSE